MSRSVSQTSSGGGSSAGVPALRASFGALLASLLLIAALLGPAAARSAQTCPNDKYRTGPSLNLPDCRAYEMVTPVKKYDQFASWPTGKHVSLQPAEVAASGNAIAFQVGQGRLVDDPTSGALGSLERAFRTEDGWRVERTVAPSDDAYTGSGVIPKWAMFSADLKKVAFNAAGRFSPLQLPKGGIPDYYGGAFLSDGTTNTWLSQPTWPGAAPAQNTELNGMWRVDGGSPDLNTIYFASIGTHTIADATAGRPVDDSSALYKWENGELTNAAILPDGSLSPGGSTMADVDLVVSNLAALPAAENKEVRANAVSADGKSLLFVSPDPGGRQAMDPLSPRPQLYLRREGEQTIMLSRRLDQGGDQPVAGTAGINPVSALGSSSQRNPSFVLATADHSVIVFATQDALTDSAAAADPALAKTYMYRAATGSLTYLPEMDNPLNPPGFGFSLLDEPGNLVALAPNGKSLLYVTPGLDLKLWREGKPTLQVSSGVTRQAAGAFGGEGSIQAMRWLDGGDTLLLQSTAALRNEPLHQPPEGGAVRQQIYLYRTQSDSLSCVSCKAGYESEGAAFSRSPNVGGLGGGGNFGPRAVERTVAADGSFVFTTGIPLVADDRNEKFDVYRWKDGNLALISSGAADAADQSLYDISESGRDIFILSREKLVPWDIDNQYDIYTARVDGGFDPPADAGAGCLGDGCLGDSAGRPPSDTLGSASLRGDGNLPATKPGRRAGRKVGFQVTRTRSAGDGRASLRVVVPRPGRIVVTGAAIRREVKEVSAGGNYSVTVALKPKAARSLESKDRLRVSVQVSYRPSQGRAATQAKKLVFQSGKGR